jgi:hypothetical protein
LLHGSDREDNGASHSRFGRYMRAVLLLTLLWLIGPGVALGQTYRCSSGASVYYSDRPCGQAPTGRLGSYGPMEPSSSRYVQGYSLQVQRAPDHFKFLTAPCAELNDAVRTAPSRGVTGQVLSDLTDEYRRKCADDDQAARQMLYKEQREQRHARESERALAAQQAAATRSQMQHCEGMRDVIGLKRKREANLNPSEVAALRTLEASYNERCLRF